MSSTGVELVSTTTARRASPPEDVDMVRASHEADATVPDGGYGWTIVLCGAVVLWWAVGSIYAWGVVQAALVENGVAGPAVLSFVGSLASSFCASLAIVNSKFMRLVGARRTAVLGMSLLGGGMILSGFAVESVGGLFGTVGVLMGVGCSLCFIVACTVPVQYFRARRGVAIGLIFAGGGWGAAAISVSLDALIHKLGLAWAFRVLGLMTLVTGLPAAWAMKERSSLAEPGFVEWRLFKDATFNLVFFAGVIGTFPLAVAPFFVPLYVQGLGFSSGTGAALVAGFSIASAVGRVLMGFLSDMIGALNALFLSSALTALSMLAIWPASTTLGPLIIFVLLSGASNGGFFSTMPTVVSNVFGSARVGVALSMMVTGWVGGDLLGTPIAGYLLEAYGGADAGLQAYRPAMLYSGSLALASAILILTARIKRTGSMFAIL